MVLLEKIIVNVIMTINVVVTVIASQPTAWSEFLGSYQLLRKTRSFSRFMNPRIYYCVYKIWLLFLFPPMLDTSPVNLTFLDFIVLMVFDRDYIL
jgi:hypothetical protein